jgi:hypothetical protein
MPEYAISNVVLSHFERIILLENLNLFSLLGKELIPFLRFRFHCRQAISKKIKHGKTIKLSKMQEKLLSTRAGLWRRTKYCVNITVSFPTRLIFKFNSYNTHIAAKNRVLKCQDHNTFIAGRNPCRGPNVRGLQSH